MVRIGLSRWFVGVSNKTIGNGQSEISLELTPFTKKVGVLVKEWKGLHDSLITKDVVMQPFCTSYKDFTYDLTPIKTMSVVNNLAAELASSAINFCINNGIVNYEEYDKSAAEYIVKCVINNSVRTGKSDDILQEDYIDLSVEMRQILAERERQKQERERLEREAYEAHLKEMEEREKIRSISTKTSFDFLYSFLNKEEYKEAIEKSQVTLKLLMGDFIVEVGAKTAHSMVHQYVNGKHIANYCIVFSDYTIPVGDEALMKIVLLKTDPTKFFKIANKFPPYPY